MIHSSLLTLIGGKWAIACLMSIRSIATNIQEITDFSSYCKSYHLKLHWSLLISFLFGAKLRERWKCWKEMLNCKSWLTQFERWPSGLDAGAGCTSWLKRIKASSDWPRMEVRSSMHHTFIKIGPTYLGGRHTSSENIESGLLCADTSEFLIQKHRINTFE